MRRARLQRRLTLVLLLAAASRAEAHAVFSANGPFVGGIKHFFISVEDVLLVLAAGILVALHGDKTANRAFFLLPGTWLLAGLAGLWTPGPAPDLPWVTASSLLITGLVAALHPPIRPAAALALVTTVAALHGWFNGSALRTDSPGADLKQLLGIAVAAIGVVIYPSALLDLCRQTWTRIAARVVASWIAATALLLLGWQLRPPR